MRAAESGDQPRVGLEREILPALLDFREHRRVEDLVADALLAPDREPQALPPVGRREPGNGKGALPRDRRARVKARLVELPSFGELEFAQVRHGEVVGGERRRGVGGERAAIELHRLAAPALLGEEVAHVDDRIRVRGAKLECFAIRGNRRLVVALLLQDEPEVAVCVGIAGCLGNHLPIARDRLFVAPLPGQRIAEGVARVLEIRNQLEGAPRAGLGVGIAVHLVVGDAEVAEDGRGGGLEPERALEERDRIGGRGPSP